MKEYPKMRENGRDGLPPSIEQKRWLIDFFIVLVIALLAFAYWYRQQLKIRHLAAQESVANATIDDLQRQLNKMTDKLNNVAVVQQAAADAGAQSTKKQTIERNTGSNSQEPTRARGESQFNPRRTEWFDRQDT